MKILSWGVGWGGVVMVKRSTLQLFHCSIIFLFLRGGSLMIHFFIFRFKKNICCDKKWGRAAPPPRCYVPNTSVICDIRLHARILFLKWKKILRKHLVFKFKKEEQLLRWAIWPIVLHNEHKPTLAHNTMWANSLSYIYIFWIKLKILYLQKT